MPLAFGDWATWGAYRSTDLQLPFVLGFRATQNSAVNVALVLESGRNASSAQLPVSAPVPEFEGGGMTCLTLWLTGTGVVLLTTFLR